MVNFVALTHLMRLNPAFVWVSSLILLRPPKQHCFQFALEDLRHATGARECRPPTLDNAETLRRVQGAWPRLAVSSIAPLMFQGPQSVLCCQLPKKRGKCGDCFPQGMYFPYSKIAPSLEFTQKGSVCSHSTQWWK